MKENYRSLFVKGGQVPGRLSNCPLSGIAGLKGLLARVLK